MISFADSICPLCSQVVPREDLYDHISAEPARVRLNTVRVIQAYHPGWVADQGACKPCWASYRDAGQILKKLSHSRHQNDFPAREHALEDQDVSHHVH